MFRQEIAFPIATDDSAVYYAGKPCVTPLGACIGIVVINNVNASYSLANGDKAVPVCEWGTARLNATLYKYVDEDWVPTKGNTGDRLMVDSETGQVRIIGDQPCPANSFLGTIRFNVSTDVTENTKYDIFVGKH